MIEGRTNLLPPGRRAGVARAYRYRLATVALLLFAAALIATTVLFVPTYEYLAGGVATQEKNLQSITAAATGLTKTPLSGELSTLSDREQLLASLAKSPSAVETIAGVLALPHVGDQVTGIAYTAAKGKSVGTLVITGTAATRAALQTYQQALQQSPHIADATVPVSAYAKDTDIPFTITIALTPSP